MNCCKIIIGAALVTILLGSCELQNQKKEQDINKIPISSGETKKAELRKRIDVKYSDAEAHYEMGKLYQNDGLWERSEMEYTIAAGFDPAHWRAEAGKAKVLIEKGEKDRAGLTAEHAMNRARVSAESSLLLGKAFQKQELDEYAVACYHQALLLAPNSAALHKQIGYYYLSKNDKIRAEEYLRRSFQLNPYQSEVAGELGRMGVIVQMPRKTQNNTRKLDKMLESNN
jgi:tetratricopeptide (TPR) repeat protein